MWPKSKKAEGPGGVLPVGAWGESPASAAGAYLSLPNARITWLVEENAPLDPMVQGFLEQSGSGAAFSDSDADPAAAGVQLKSFFGENGVIIFIHGKANARAATPCHIPGTTMRTLGAFGLPLLPIAIEYPRESALSIERTASLPRAILAVGKLIPSEK